MTAVVTSYTFTCDGSPAADEHHNLLSDICDPQTRSLLRGLNPRGWHCLEVGAGAGSIALWLATQVGPGGSVLATDLNPMPIRHHCRLTVIRHDIVNQPLPRSGFDLIHARLLLQHLPQRREVVERLVAALNPHGVLVAEDWDLTWRHGRVLHAPDQDAADLFNRYQDTLWDIFSDAGVDLAWASHAATVMIGAGLEDVSTQVHCRSWAGGTAGTRLIAGGISMVEDKLLARGLTIPELERVRNLMADPNMLIRTPPMVSTIGHQPHSLS